MRFFMLSDFHLSEASVPETEQRLKRLFSKIRSDVDTIEEILFILMGDLIDRGNGDAFCLIDKMIALIRDELSDYVINFEAIPGNHDLVNKSIERFSACVSGQGISKISENCPVYSRCYGEVNLIFADSTLTRDYRAPGKLDLEKINSFIVPDKKNLLFSHHGFTQSHGDEHNVVADGREILKELGDMGISFAFHAHTHRADIGSKVDKVVEIGCGSFSGDLTGMSGITHQFTMGGVCANGSVFVERWIDAKDGTGDFLYDSLYPETRHFTDPRMVGKLKYEADKQYIITRHIMPHELSMQDEWARYFSDEKEQDLFDILRKTNYLLLADAGQGKSVALRGLANRLYDSTYFPLLFSLKNYTGKSVDELLPESYRGLNPSRLAILFDGYDELTNEMLPLFEANLNEFISKWPGARVVLSSRSNFCKTEQTNESMTFPGFQVYDLCPLERRDIEQYLAQQGIDTEQFWTAARASNVAGLCKNPFYLTRLAELFRREHILPPKTELMDKLIQDGFEIDNQKFPGTLEEIYQELFCSLERVAYAMQLLGKNQLDDREEYQRIFDHTERQLLKKSGLIEREGRSWSFTHNNFREFLAARYLCKLSEKEAIHHFFAGTEIKPDWVNTLGYLVNMTLNWDLQDWLLRNAPNALVKFEPDRLASDTRSKVLIRIFLYYEEKQLRYQDSLCTEEELAVFGCSPRTLDFLLQRIGTPVNQISQNNAIRLLRYIPKFYGKQTQVKETLLTFCGQYPDVPAPTCRLAMFVLIERKLSSNDTTQRLMELFGKATNDYIRCGMYEYLLEAKAQDQYVQFYLDGLPLVMESKGHYARLSNELAALRKGLESMTSPESVAKIFEWFAGHAKLHFYYTDEVVEYLCQQAADLYSQGSTEVFPAVFDFYKVVSRHGHWNQIRSVLEFFRHTDQVKDIVLELASLGRSGHFGLVKLMDQMPEAFEFIEQAYMDGSLQQSIKFSDLVISCVQDEEKYKRYAELILNKEGKKLPDRLPQRDYNAECRLAEQQYFNMLFEPDTLQAWTNELIRISKFTEPTVDQIAEEYLKFDRTSPLTTLQYAMHHYVAKQTKVSDFCSTVCWNSFILVEAERVIQQKKVAPTPKQLERITQSLQAVIGTCIETAPNSVLTKSVVELSVRLHPTYPEEILLGMTKLYDFFFAEEEGTNQKYAYLESYLTADKIKDQLVKDVANGQLNPHVLRDHLCYLKKQQCDDLLIEATKVCQSEKKDLLLRREALDYVYQLAGEEYVCEEIVPNSDGEFLLEIQNMCKKVPRKIIRDAMEKQFVQAPDMHLLGNLITLQSPTAVEYYTKLVMQKNQVPKMNLVPDSTEAIGTLKDPELLPQLERLMQVMFTEGFKDGEFYTLAGSLDKAFVSCGIFEPQKVKEILERQVQMKPENDSCIRWCNQVAEDLKFALLKSKDAPISLERVIKIMKNGKH